MRLVIPHNTGTEISGAAPRYAAALRATDVSFDFIATSIAGLKAGRKHGELGANNAGVRNPGCQLGLLERALIARGV